MTTEKPLVGILMGSKSDWEVMKNVADTLGKFGVAARAACSRRTARRRRPPST